MSMLYVVLTYIPYFFLGKDPQKTMNHCPSGQLFCQTRLPLPPLLCCLCAPSLLPHHHFPSLPTINFPPSSTTRPLGPKGLLWLSCW